MVTPEHAIEFVYELVEGLSAAEMQMLGIQALVAWHNNYPQSDTFQLNGPYGERLAYALAKHRGKVLPDARLCAEAFNTEVGEPRMARCLEFLWWLI